MRLPNEFGGLHPEAALEALTQRLDIIHEEVSAVEQRLQAISKEWCYKLNQWLVSLIDELDAIEVMSRLGETEHTFIIFGWVPTRDFARLKLTLEKEIGKRVFVYSLEVTPEVQKSAPVAIENPKAVRPFESLLKMLSIPRYDDIDPSGLMALFIPLFFGMMLGDVGYGLILFLASFALLYRIKGGFSRDILRILQIGSFWSVIFGFLYGEVFGSLGEKFGIHPIWMDRGDPENMIALVLTFIGVGAAHISLGLILGVWKAAVNKNRSHLLERGGMLIGIIGLFMLVATLSNLLPESMTTPAFAVMIIGIVLLGASLGKAGIFVGPIEFISVFGNILSYMRIAAIGLASVYLAKVANDLCGMIGNLIIGIIVAVLIHALNIVMGAFSPTIHSVRLNYVEFFRKFYQGGGQPYKPFKSKFIADG